MTIAELYNDFVSRLSGIYDKREAANITDWVMESVTALSRAKILASPEFDVSEKNRGILHNYLHQLLQHKPVQYVLNEAWFYKMRFYINEHVLIPRPETEELVSWIVEEDKIDESRSINILDIGTGSGCIAVSLKKNIPRAAVTAIDISEKALEVANKNARELNTPIHFLQIDFLNDQSSDRLHRYDVIVSNPPYIPINEKEKLARNVAAFEPPVALFVNNDTPFLFYEVIAAFSKKHLNENGKIYAEVHEDYATEVSKIFSEKNFIPEIRKDMYGKNRMIKATRKN